jgi:predicted negative regulator of RcsB-dependent stress response
MANQSAFDQNHIEENAMSETSGLLDQLNLPPAFIAFLRNNQRTLWIIAAIVATVVTIVSLYGSYRNYKENQAVAAFDSALLADNGKRTELLQQIVDNYSSTPTAPWARIELAKIAVAAKDIPTAVNQLQQVNQGISKKNPLKPLVLYRLAGLNEQTKNFEQALTLYRELTDYTGFSADAQYAMGRVYVAMDKKNEAITAYQQYLSLTEKSKGTGQADPVRTLVEYTIKELQ